jgi:hypothetical protein
MSYYCEVGDLLLGNLQGRLPSQIDPAEFVKHAAEEMDSKIGFVYVTPINVDPEPDPPLVALPVPQVLLLKHVCAKLASGRIILAAAIGHEDSTVHQYGLYLVREAEVTLMAIANQEVNLAAPTVDSEGNPDEPVDPPTSIDPMAFVPGGKNRDDFAAVAAFEDNYMTDNYPCEAVPWIPGPRPE